MDELFEIYKQIEYLRNRGVKMKEIADYTNLAPSVLSSLYSNVLPTFANTVRKGTPKEEALDYALSQVNNVSKKKLMGNIQVKYLQPIITQYFIDNKSEIWLLFLIAHSKR